MKKSKEEYIWINYFDINKENYQKVKQHWRNLGYELIRKKFNAKKSSGSISINSKEVKKVFNDAQKIKNINYEFVYGISQRIKMTNK